MCISSVQLLSHVLLFANPWITACQASLSITNSRSSPRLTSIKSVMPSSHPLSSPSPPAPNPSQHQSLFQWVNSSHEVAKVLEKTLMLGGIGGRRRRGRQRMAGWHHWLDGHEFEQAPVIDDGQGSLAGCSPWGHKESDTTEWLNWTE